MQWLDREAAAGQVPEEADLGFPAETRLDQVGDLGDDEGGNDKRAGMGLQQPEAGGVMVVVGVDVSVEGAGVEDQRDGAISEARISSIRSETSLWPLWPMPAASSRRRPPAAEMLLERAASDIGDRDAAPLGLMAKPGVEVVWQLYGGA